MRGWGFEVRLYCPAFLVLFPSVSGEKTLQPRALCGLAGVGETLGGSSARWEPGQRRGWELGTAAFRTGTKKALGIVLCLPLSHFIPPNKDDSYVLTG